MADQWNVFISYAHKDNIRFTTERKGWVDRFYGDLQAQLGSVAGKQVKIWHDSRLGGGEYFAETIDETTANCSLLVPLISKNYIADNNGWLRRELKSFVAGNARRGPHRNKTRTGI